MSRFFPKFRRSAFGIGILLLPLLFSCSAYEVAILDNTPLKSLSSKTGRFKAVVLPFRMTGARWGTEFSEAVSLHLIKTGKFEIVERAALRKILREQRITKSGLFDPDTQVKLGRLLGAHFIFLGNGTASVHRDSEGKAYRNLVDTMTLKVIHVETGSNYAIIRKKYGIAWNWPYRAMWCLSMGFVWDRKDILTDSTQYDQVASDLVSELEGTVLDRIPLPSIPGT